VRWKWREEKGRLGGVHGGEVGVRQGMVAQK